VALDAQKGEECLAVARIGSTILLTYECTVEADMKDRERAGVQLSRIWHVAPIFDLGKIPADARIVNEATGESILMRDVVKGNASANYFYLDPLPDARDDVGHYVDFRKLAPISVEYLIPEMDKRLVTLNEDALNGCLNQLMWFFTRAKYLHEPVACPHCGKEVNLAEVLEGQELDLQQ